MNGNARVFSASRRLLFLALLNLIVLIGMTQFAPAALATICNQFAPPPELYVGDTDTSSPTYDAACTHNDIQTAIDDATCVYGTKIFITHEVATTGQQLNINNKNVTLIGRHFGDRCGSPPQICNPVCLPPPPPPTAPQAVIAGASGASVITINGTSHVTVQYLEITNPGNSAGGNGGGIDFDGSGTLTLDTSWVGNNHETYGGGVYFNGTGATTSTLSVLAHTEIFANTADGSGGGIEISGNAVLKVLQADTQINANHAPDGYGGGIDVVGPAQANIGSPNFNGFAVISGNDAKYGGGIAIRSTDNDDALVNLFTTDSTQPVGIANNTASHTGGGIYLRPNLSGPTDATVCAKDFRLVGNVAVEGAAIYGDLDSDILQDTWGSTVFIGGGCSPSDSGAVACTNTALCNTVDGNETVDPTQGSVILMQDGGYLGADRFAMRKNHVGHAIRFVGEALGAHLSDCLLAENVSSGELIYAGSGNIFLDINSCTLANDQIGSSHVIHAEYYLNISNSIIDEQGTLALDFSGDAASYSANYVLSNDTSTLPGAGLGEPSFVDESNGDYHLAPGSLGIDFSPATGGGIDLDNNPRTYDLPSVGNVFGARDLGPYERQNLFRECGATDSLYCDGFGP